MMHSGGIFHVALSLSLSIQVYLFYSKRPTEVNWWMYLNHISPQGTKEEQEKSPQHRCFPENFAEFLRTTFLKNTSGGYF